MNSFIETLNQWGGNFPGFAWPMFWQSSLLIVALFACEFLLRRRLRASIRYTLWLVVLVKLCVPPTFALPTSPVWWLHQTPPPVTAKPKLPQYTVTYDQEALPELPQTSLPTFTTPKPVMTKAAWLLGISASASVALLFWMLIRWWQIARLVRRAATSERLTALADEARCSIGMKNRVPVRLTAKTMSPAVCGLFLPTILIPQSLAAEFSDEQLRTVLLHELIHVRRCDVWLNFLQTLLQIGYWWHPLVWVANARIRRVREEAVDDAVMLALCDEAETYAPTLLEVAKLALNRPLATLGLVGILESRSALRQRIERLVDFHPPRKAGLTFASLCGIFVFSAVALPMGEAPVTAENENVPVVSTSAAVAQNSNSIVAPIAGILTNHNFRVAIHALEQRNGKESLAEPEVVTSSGRGINRITMTNISVPLSTAAISSAGQKAVTFKLEYPVRRDELKAKLLAAGVNIPPTTFFYTDTGILLVRGSEEQLARVNRLILKLNGYSATEIEAAAEQFSKHPDSKEFEYSTNLLMTRIFKVDANVFSVALRNVSGLQTNSVSAMARSLFSTLGVDWELPQGKAVFYNDGLGKLFVKATVSDLDTIEQAISALNRVAPQIHIKARFVEVPKGTIHLESLTMSLNAKSGELVGIMNHSNFQAALEDMESKNGSETLGEPEVTTLSGRQSQMRATEVVTVVTNLVFQDTFTNQDGAVVTNTIVPQTCKVETGPILDVVPYVLSDGYTINLALIPSVTEFLGYDKSTNTTVAYTRTGEKIDVPKISPRFTVREVVATLNLWDGQTAIISGIPEATYVNGSATTGKPKARDKELLIFITATIVDPAGNRVHKDDELQFAQTGVPPQPPQPK